MVCFIISYVLFTSYRALNYRDCPSKNREISYPHRRRKDHHKTLLGHRNHGHTVTPSRCIKLSSRQRRERVRDRRDRRVSRVRRSELLEPVK